MEDRLVRRLSAEHQRILHGHLSEFPVKLGKLARSLGVAAIKVSNMKAGISGQISKEDGAYVIRVNRNEARERQRFTIAHELAHYLLHRNIIDASPDGIKDNVLYRSGESDQVERDANKLAAVLVMPKNLITKKLADDFDGLITDATIESLASSFEVSRAAMEIRLSSLGQR